MSSLKIWGLMSVVKVLMSKTIYLTLITVEFTVLSLFLLTVMSWQAIYSQLCGVMIFLTVVIVEGVVGISIFISKLSEGEKSVILVGCGSL